MSTDRSNVIVSHDTAPDANEHAREQGEAELAATAPLTPAASPPPDADGSPPPAAASPRRWWDPRRLIAVVPKPLRHAFTVFVILLVFIYLGFPAISKADRALGLLNSVNVLWLIAGFLFEGASLYSYACLTRTLMPADGPSLWTLFRVDMSTLAVSHIIPGGTAPGTALGYRLMTSTGASGPDSGFAMASQGIGSAVVLNVLLWLALVISIPIAGFKPAYVTVALVGVLLLAFFATIIYLLNQGEDVAARVLRAVARPIPVLRGDKVEAVVRRIGVRIRLLSNDRETLGRSLAWASANWLLDAASLWAFVAAFGHFISPIYLFVAYGVGNVLAAIPLTPGGVGIVESVVPAALIGFGLPGGVAYLAVVGWRLVNFWLPIPVGAGMYISLRVDRERLKHMRAREALAQLRTIPGMTAPVTGQVPITGTGHLRGAARPGDGAPVGTAASPDESASPATPAEPTEAALLLGGGRRGRGRRDSPSPEGLTSRIAASEASRRKLRSTGSSGSGDPTPTPPPSP
jgi:putative heme transporter